MKTVSAPPGPLVSIRWRMVFIPTLEESLEVAAVQLIAGIPVM